MSGNPDALKGYYGELFEAAYEDQVFGDADRTSVIIDSPDPLGDEFRDADDDSGFLGQDDIGNPNENFLELKYAQPNIEVTLLKLACPVCVHLKKRIRLTCSKPSSM
jgi:hypothetical protein